MKYNSKKPRKTQTFAKGALIMSMGMFIVKIMGAFFKIPLTAILGGEGMGYFNSAYNLYSPIYAIATAGLPIAISRMVSGDMERGRFRDIKKIHKISIPIFIITGSFCTILMMAGANIFASYTHAPGVIYSIFTLAPTVFFACLISTYKGYYEGLHNMIPTAVSEVVESTGKVVFGIGFAYATVKFAMNEYYSKGTVFGASYPNKSAAKDACLPFASSAAVLGITIAAAVGYLYMLLKYKIGGDGITKEEVMLSPKPRSNISLVKILLSISIPIGLGAVIMNLAGVVDSFLVQNRLNEIMAKNPNVLLKIYEGLIPKGVIDRGVTHVFLWGCFGYMSTITMMVPAISQGISISAMPSVTAAWVQGGKDKIKSSIESIFKLTCLISMPAGLGLAFLSYPVMDLVYGSMMKQPGEVYVASSIMSVAGVAVVFNSISTPICTMLQAVGRVDLPVKLLTIGVLIKVILNYVLVGIPIINIQGASVGTLVCYVFVAVTALYFLCKETKIKLDLKSTALKPLFASICSSISAYAFQGLFSRALTYKLATVFSIAIAVIVYIIFILITKTLNEDDIKMLPKGNKIYSKLKKYNLV